MTPTNEVFKKDQEALKKTLLKSEQTRERALAYLKAMSEVKGHIYESYRALYRLWRSNNSAVSELGPFFRIPGVEPDGRLTVDNVFEDFIRVLATQIVPLMSVKQVNS